MREACPDHTMPDLTEEQVDNLYTLAEFLETLPPDYGNFEMKVFLRHRNGGGNNYITEKSILVQEQNVCGTVACAIGHGPTAGIAPSKNREDWWVYAKDKFTNHNNEVFEWCFGADWSYYDNTPHGAAARIRYMLSNGVPNYWTRPSAKSLYEGCLIGNRQKSEEATLTAVE